MMTWNALVLTALAVHGTGVQASDSNPCAMDFERSNAALNLIHVCSLNTTQPRILCFVNTISPNHDTKARTIKETWGKRCDKLVFMSNVTDDALGAVAIDHVPSDHNHLWQKHKASIEYIWDRYRHEFEWFYKADDDAYVIMENLRAYLRSPEIVMQQDVVPLQLGHRFRLTDDLIEYYVGDRLLLDAYQQRWPHWWVFNSGGPGVAMNSLFMQLAVQLFPQWTCLRDEHSQMLPDDAAIAFCMAWYDVFPPNTRDLRGRERWHANHPHGVYFTDPSEYPDDIWFNQYHRGIGGIQWKDDCCAPDSIAFHYVSPDYMLHIERQLYTCRASGATSLRQASMPVGDHGPIAQDVVFS
ncbi:hypothetical protein, variant 1 [Aphanomyces invadans]|uniref:N-acetylgalactosaminide beta-1,3-galactosyltransferase n=1 Tax=Aphanomyces invadans TaxID=157072 RepID=A0A024TT29_9STRA|nr:hypothetical protein, variant 1 [Aphanomyces invadans]ETV97193.1 hypothetical protein, variant 1 [Aphanomyces invadans]|eukprot:XP_008874440.1 hypothetical protein, variant 1 [Aphanomyces invadans]